MTGLLTTGLRAEHKLQSPQWDGFYRRWLRLVPPLRPDAGVCVRMRALIAPAAGPVLVLGATPELTAVAPSTVAIDWSAPSLAMIWPGHAPGRQAVRADWLHLPCSDGAFVAAAGDGSLNCLQYPDGYRRLFQTLTRAVRPGGRIVLRVFVSPDPRESMAQARFDAMAGSIRTIGALKWRMAHLVAGEHCDPNVPAPSIADAFDRCFPDRAALRRATGWSDEDLAEIDVLADVPGGFSFPNVAQLLETLPAGFGRASLLASGAYELADRCPLLVLDIAP
jgi:SAM-dependent methyltransferase